ncbi:MULTISPECIES: ABC transporter permease [Pseudomonas]|uniref:ABC transporter permease n=1 Tax=Pseudomonas TaxID=286 RepID=UPI0008636546|nr:MULTISPECIES: ABC transporter permease [Pseudomonas]MDG9889978.1 ABC transporter permease [Pseudomonas juntendi]RFQ03447.1 ABC transporter permease [Pseudomonas putida]
MGLNITQRQTALSTMLAAPSMAFMLVFFVFPCVLLLLYSFWTARSFVIDPTFNLNNYARTLVAAGFWRTGLTGLTNGLWTAIVSVVLSFPAAYYIVYRARNSVAFYLILLSWFSSYLVRVYAWRTILGTNGLINSTLMQWGLIDQPLEFLLFSPFASIITLVHIMFPFALLLLVSALRDVKQDYLDAARDLGASRTQVLFKVIVPMAYKGIVSAFMFTFILAAGDYITPQLLGGRDGVTNGLLIANQFRSAGNWPLGAAMAFITLVLFVGIYLAFTQMLRALRLAPGLRFHDQERTPC